MQCRKTHKKNEELTRFKYVYFRDVNYTVVQFITTYTTYMLNYRYIYCLVSRDSVISIATRYGLEGLGVESRWMGDFPCSSKPTHGPTQPPVQ